MGIDLRTETDTAPSISLLVRAGVQVEEVHRGRPCLEGMFLTRMEEAPAPTVTAVPVLTFQEHGVGVAQTQVIRPRVEAQGGERAGRRQE